MPVTVVLKVLFYLVFSLLDKVMSRKQRHIGVHECHLLCKGPKQLEFKFQLN